MRAPLAAIVIVLSSLTSAAQYESVGASRSILDTRSAPEWLSLPANAEVTVPPGVRLQVVSTSIVSNDARKEAALVGLFRNVGRPLNGAVLSLSYIGVDGESVLASTANGALVSAVKADELLPFRFPLLQGRLLPANTATVRVTVEERTAVRRPVAAHLGTTYSVRGLSNQRTVAKGQIDVSSSSDHDPGESLAITAVLLDNNGQVLDVLAGEAVRVTAGRYTFELSGTMPVASRTRDVQVRVETSTRSAVAQSCPALQVRNPDGNYIIPGVKGDIPYSGNLALDAYVQQGPAQRPSIVVIHGGAWSAGSRIAHVGQILEALTRAGYNWFSVDYRLGGLTRFEDSLTDVRAALAFIRCRAADLGINANELVLLGEDSGAHLAGLLAAERPAGVIGVVLIGGFYDLGAIPALSGGTDRDVLARASPVTRVSRQMPPLLVVHGAADDEAPAAHARRYCDQSAKDGGGCQFLEVAGAGHRSENWLPSQWTYKRQMVEWLSALTPLPAFTHRPLDGVVLKDIIYSSSAQLKLDAFLPQVDTPVPAVIVVHGGGWEAGDKVTYVTPLFEPLARARLAWFSIDYRLTPAFAHEDQLEDVRQAIRFVRAEHERFNIDPARIVLVGESASGQIVSLMAAEDGSLAGVVSFYGVYDFAAMVTDAAPRSLLVRLFRRTVLDEESRATLRRYSPSYQAHKDMPPVLLVNGTGERLWPQAEAFARRLTELGVRHELIALGGAPHGMENWEGHPEWMVYKPRVVEWIQQVVAKSARRFFPDPRLNPPGCWLFCASPSGDFVRPLPLHFLPQSDSVARHRNAVDRLNSEGVMPL